MQPIVACPDDSVQSLEQYEHARVFPTPAQHDSSFCDAFVKYLESLGVTLAFGIVGGPIAPFSEALLRSSIKVIHTRHEGGAAFCAAEAYFASGRPSVLFTTSGPGFFNALTGIAAARRDGAKMIIVSATTSPTLRGRGPAQEISADTVPINGLYTSGPLFHYGVIMEQAAELQNVAARLRAGLNRPHGFMAHIALPIPLQTSAAPHEFTAPPHNFAKLPANVEAARECAKALSGKKFGIWVGFGARHAAASIRELVERTGCGVLSSPRGKGVFPEDHPQFMGVTGLGGHVSAEQYMAEERPHYMLVLGTRLGEATTYWSPRLVPPGGFIHVDLDPEAIGAAYPTAKCLAIQGEIDAFVKALLSHMPSAPLLQPPPTIERRSVDSMEPVEDVPVRPEFVMQAVQDVFVDGSDAPVMTESGNAFAWGNHFLRFQGPNRYRVSVHYGSMGHFVCGVVGAALARGGKAVAIVGDGSMLMNNEVSTAVAYGANAIWVVLNDSQYGMVEQGMNALGYRPVETALPATDFATMARAMGARGIRVHHEQDLYEAFKIAKAAHGPVVIDVLIDRDAASPLLKRIESLIEQGMRGTRGAP